MEHFVCLSVVATGFLICSLILLCCPFYKSRFSKQTTIATSSLHAKWIYFNVHPVDMVTMDPDHFPLNLDLLFWKKKIQFICLTYIYFTSVILSLLWCEVSQANCHCYKLLAWQVAEFQRPPNEDASPFIGWGCLLEKNPLCPSTSAMLSPPSDKVQ
jgi:hypothetical protein